MKLDQIEIQNLKNTQITKRPNLASMPNKEPNRIKKNLDLTQKLNRVTIFGLYKLI